MKCPNCGTIYTENETLCKKCNTPLGNADYTQVIPDVSRKKKRKLRIVLFSILFFILLVIGIIGGYLFYIKQIETKCEEATKKIFTYAHEMDFSQADSSYLPDTLRENPDIRELIQEQIQTIFEGNELGSLLKIAGIEIDTEQICDAILDSAYYEITDVTADYHSCTVTVHTKNTDLMKLPGIFTEAIQSEIQENGSLWDTLKNAVHYFFFDKNQDNSENKNSISLYDWYEESKDDIPRTEATGTIQYAIVNGRWTITSIDEKLFYSYYGINDSLAKQIIK